MPGKTLNGPDIVILRTWGEVPDSRVKIPATDSDGNVATASFTVTVETVATPVPPVITNVPTDMTVTTKKSSDTEATVRWRSPSATDYEGNSLPINVTSSPTPGLDSGSRFPLGTTTINLTATDSLGQSTTTSFTITVVAKSK